MQRRRNSINYPDEESAQLLRCCGALVLQTGTHLSSIIQNGGNPTEEAMSKIQKYNNKGTST